MSGDALSSTHDSPSADTAMELWVRAWACSSPWRWPAHSRQLQFHCGKPPPAPEPSTRIFMAVCGGRWRNGSAIRDVHRDLEAEAHVFKRGLRPLHGSLLGLRSMPGQDCRDGQVLFRKTHADRMRPKDPCLSLCAAGCSEVCGTTREETKRELRGDCSTRGQRRAAMAQGFPVPERTLSWLCPSAACGRSC